MQLVVEEEGTEIGGEFLHGSTLQVPGESSDEIYSCKVLVEASGNLAKFIGQEESESVQSNIFSESDKATSH